MAGTGAGLGVRGGRTSPLSPAGGSEPRAEGLSGTREAERPRTELRHHEAHESSPRVAGPAADDRLAEAEVELVEALAA